MNIMITMTLDDIKKLPELIEEEVSCIKDFKNRDFSDCPKQTKEDLAKFRPAHEVHLKSGDICKASVTKK